MPDSGFVLPPAFRVVTDGIAAVNGGSIENLIKMVVKDSLGVTLAT